MRAVFLQYHWGRFREESEGEVSWPGSWERATLVTLAARCPSGLRLVDDSVVGLSALKL